MLTTLHVYITADMITNKYSDNWIKFVYKIIKHLCKSIQKQKKINLQYDAKYCECNPWRQCITSIDEIRKHKTWRKAALSQNLDQIIK